MMKDPKEVRYQSTLWICNKCFNEKMYEDQLFKDSLIQVTDLNNKKWVLFLILTKLFITWTIWGYFKKKMTNKTLYKNKDPMEKRE